MATLAKVRAHKRRRPKPEQRRARLQKALNVAAVGHTAPPRRDFDLKQVEEFGKLGCSLREMASLFSTSEQVLHDRMTEEEPERKDQRDLLPDDWGKFLLAYERGRASACRAVRAKQLALALAGNERMLIHLGQHLLGQIPISAVDLKAAFTGDVEFTIKASDDVLDLAPAAADTAPAAVPPGK
jgi:hypothetical protein